MKSKQMLIAVAILAAILLPLGGWVWNSRHRSDGVAAGGVVNIVANSDPAKRAANRQQRMDEMTKAIGLSAEQASKISAIRSSTRPLIGDILRNQKLTEEQKQASIADIRKIQRDQISKFLSVDQMTLYAAYEEKRAQERTARRAATAVATTGGLPQ